MQPSSASGANTQGEQHLRAQLELLKSHDIPSLSSPSSNHARDPRNPPPIQPAPSRPSNGYEGLTPATQETAQAIIAKASADAHIHPDLRAHPHHAQPANMMPIAPPTGHEPGATAGPAAPIAPAPSAQIPMDDPNDGRKAKRELSQSKRAAQNRAAQRAFRQRKEGYIKKLEQQVRDYAEMESSYKMLEAENRALRDYVVQCQSRLVEVTGEYPPPPSNVNLSQPPAPQGPPMNAPEPPPSNAAVGTPLEAVAQAVAGLAAHEQMTEQRQSYPSPTFKSETFKTEQVSDDTRSAEEINRHLQDEGAPATNM